MSLVKYNNNSISAVTSTALAIGDRILIKTLTASSSANLSFVHGSNGVVLDNTYPIYVFKFIDCHPATNEQQLYMSGSVNSGSNYEATNKITTCFRAYHSESGSSGTLSYYAAGDIANSTDSAFLTVESSNENDHAASGEMLLFNPSNTTFVKHFISRSNAVYNDSSDFSMNFHVAGFFKTASAINGIRFRFNSGNMDSGTIKLYGIKDS